MATDNEFLRLIYLALANSSGGTSGAGMTAAVKDGLDTSLDIESIKTQLGDLAVLTANSQFIYDQLVLNGADNETQTAAAIDASADVDAIIDRLDSLVASANQSVPASQFRRIENYNYNAEVVQNTNQYVVFQVPAGYAWDLSSVLAYFSTSSTVANRYLSMSVSDGYGGLVYARTISPYAQTASQSLTYSLQPGIHPQAASGSPYVMLPLPTKLLLPEYHIIAFEVYNYQSAIPFDGGFDDGSVKLGVRQVPLI